MVLRSYPAASPSPFLLTAHCSLIPCSLTMTITWYGQACFRIDAREAVIAIDPFAKEIGLTPPRFQADITLVTHGHFDHANTGALAGAPTIIAGPGEYEVKGVAVRGIPSFHDRSEGRERGPNTIYRIGAEEMTLVHLGDFGEAALRDETLEAIGDTDILFIPVGGAYTIDAAGAAKVVSQIEPRIIIPMHYHLPGLKVKLEPVEGFLKALGVREPERLPKLVIRKRDLPENANRVVILAASGER